MSAARKGRCSRRGVAMATAIRTDFRHSGARRRTATAQLGIGVFGCRTLIEAVDVRLISDVEKQTVTSVIAANPQDSGVKAPVR